MLVDGLFVMLQIGYPIAILLNIVLGLTFFLRPLKMNASKYFIPIMAAQNIIFSMCSMLAVPVRVHHSVQVEELCKCAYCSVRLHGTSAGSSQHLE